jgi:hypothetical protein
VVESDKEQGDSATNEEGWPASLLNANHRRVLASTLRRVELAAWRLEEQLGRSVSPELALTRFINPLSAPQRAALLRLTQQVRQEVMQLASDYCLDVAEDDLSKVIKAEFSLLWSDLEEVRPQKLRNYGTVDPQAQAVLGPPVQRLIKLMLAINDVASEKQDVIDMWQEASDNSSEGRER